MMTTPFKVHTHPEGSMRCHECGELKARAICASVHCDSSLCAKCWQDHHLLHDLRGDGMAKGWRLGCEEFFVATYPEIWAIRAAKNSGDCPPQVPEKSGEF